MLPISTPEFFAKSSKVEARTRLSYELRPAAAFSPSSITDLCDVSFSRACVGALLVLGSGLSGDLCFELPPSRLMVMRGCHVGLNGFDLQF